MIQVIWEIARQRRRTLATILVLLLFNIAVLVFLKAYLASAIIDAQAKWSDLRRRAAVAGQNDASTIYRRGKADLEQLKAHIPHKSQFPGLLAGIFDTAASDGVRVGAVSYKPSVVKENKALLSYGLTMSVSGSYAAVKNFLADMQKSSELIALDGMAMSNNDPYEENVTMNLSLTLYLQEAP